MFELSTKEVVSESVVGEIDFRELKCYEIGLNDGVIEKITKSVLT